jgi:hypothetical protein
MKALRFLIVSFCGISALMCGTSNDFTKSKREKSITLSDVSSKKVLFVLQNEDTLVFSNPDVCDIIDKRITDQLKGSGYVVSKELAVISAELKEIQTDTAVFQNLAEVDSKTISGNLDIWIARELMLKGRVAVGRYKSTERITMLKYVYQKDKLGGERGTFYSKKGEVIYSTVISLVE